jgi:hypothetical protein
VIIQNRLADTVFASDKDVDALKIPDLLDAVAGGKRPLWDVLYRFGYTQIVKFERSPSVGDAT